MRPSVDPWWLAARSGRTCASRRGARCAWSPARDTTSRPSDCLARTYSKPDRVIGWPRALTKTSGVGAAPRTPSHARSAVGRDLPEWQATLSATFAMHEDARLRLKRHVTQLQARPARRRATRRRSTGGASRGRGRHPSRTASGAFKIACISSTVRCRTNRVSAFFGGIARMRRI